MGGSSPEYFISFETKDRSTIFGFCRLRLSKYAGQETYHHINGCGLIRELHVYGQLIAVSTPLASSSSSSSSRKGDSQHVGFGKQLMFAAEKIAYAHGFKRTCVISGVGVRHFYRKLGEEWVVCVV
jgi:elongator complex protein 3